MRFSDMASGDTDLPNGVRDFLPFKAAKAEYLQQQLQQVYKSWGFRPLITPQLEYLDVLERGLGEGLRERTFRFDDRQSGRLLAFPPDMTPQIARIAATRMAQLPLPLRLCYSGRVLRHAEQRAGKDRDIFQSGAELIGVDGPDADAEMIAMAIEALTAVGADDFTIDIGQVDFFHGVMDDLSLAPDLMERVADAILRKDGSELSGLLEQVELHDGVREEILALPRLYGGREVLEQAERVVRNDRSRAALDGLARVLDELEGYQVLDRVTIDLGELRGLNYHTGITFQGFLPGVGRTVCSGGRYNQLTARYGFPAPATGFTFSVLDLLFALDKVLDGQVASVCDLLLCSAPENSRRAQDLSRRLRTQGFAVVRDLSSRDPAAALVYARQMNFRYLAVVGDETYGVELIRVVDGQREQLSWSRIEADGLVLK